MILILGSFWFQHKYQLNIDGTVAAYRFPYLLAGGSLVLKQDSKYYEHFYKELKPYEHYVPFKHDLSDLLQQIQWAKDNDEEVWGLCCVFSYEIGKSVLAMNALGEKIWVYNFFKRTILDSLVEHISEVYGRLALKSCCTYASGLEASTKAPQWFGWSP